MKQNTLHAQPGKMQWAAPPDTLPYLRTLLYVGPSDNISQPIAAAIEREFPALSVMHAADLKATRDEFELPLRLLLVDWTLAQELNNCAGEVLKRHTDAVVVIVTDCGFHESVKGLHSIDSRLIKGVLPLNVSLDVLLSMLRIVLKGGTYFPSIEYRQTESHSGESGSVQSAGDERSNSAQEIPGKTLHQLTKRENEILGKIAQGNQNKIIASALGLSEHTVKIHIHNIITKLGVHNRTEAVAIYFEQKEQGSDA